MLEAFFLALKLERELDDSRKELIRPQRLRRDLAFWIEGYDSRENRHPAVGYLSPTDLEQPFISIHTLTPVITWSISTKLGQPHC